MSINSTDTPQDNPSDPNNVSYQGETPPWDEVIRMAIQSNNVDLHTWLPAKVTSVNPLLQTVSLEIQLKRLYSDGSLVTIPIIQNVPVQMPRGADYWVRLPIATGDTGIALFCERSLDIWTVAGGVVDPQDNRTHHLSDPVFIPGVFPFSQPIPPASSLTQLTDMILHNGNGEIYIQKAGTFLVKNKTAELMDILTKTLSALSDVATALTEMTTATLIGPQPPINIASFISALAEIEPLIPLLATLKGG